MKTRKDPRHLGRIKTMQELFTLQFNNAVKPETDYAKKISRNIKKIDALITQSAPTWPLEKINRIDLAILRLAVYELIIDKKNPPKVIVDEAVEIAKEFGGDSSPSFVNGALGKLISDQKIKT